MTPHQPKQYEISEFSLYGERQDDGTILLGFSSTPRPMPDFPPEVDLFGSVYTLEHIEENKVTDEGLRESMSPEALAKAERICWGIYV